MSANGELMSKREAERVQARPFVTPRVDVFENNDELLLLADLPGVAEDGLKIQVDGDELTLEATPVEEPQGALWREQRRFDFRRSFLLPRGVDRDKVAASLEKGVLTLRLPKAAAAKPRRIEIKA